MSKILEKAEQDRQSASAMINWLEKKIRRPATALVQVEIEHYMGEVQKCQLDVIDAHKRIIGVKLDAAEMVTHDNEYVTLLDEVSKLQIDLKTMLSKLPSPSTTTTSGPPPSTSQPDIRLPRIELPSFDGNINDWLSFKDLFESTVANNRSLKDVQKLAYLMTAVKGEAARQIKTMALTDANYQTAWNLLENRYQNNRELVFSILRKFTGQPHIQVASSTALRSLIDTSRECIRTLEKLTVPVEHWDLIVVFHMYYKTDNQTRELWEQTLTGGAFPTLKELLEFLEKRARALAAGGHISLKKPSQPVQNARAHHTQVPNTNCKLCNQFHTLTKCSKFIEMSLPDRKNFIQKINACQNCLRPGHGVRECFSKFRCRTCSEAHHTLLHQGAREHGGNQPTGGQPPPSDPSSSRAITNHARSSPETVKTALLATALVKVQDKYGSYHHCRVLLDSGSNASFISEACVTMLGLTRQRATTEIIGLGSSAVGTSRGVVALQITPHFESPYVINVTTLIVSRVTEDLPVQEYDKSDWTHLDSLQLADPKYNVPDTIDILLGSEIFFDILQGGKRTGPEGTPVAIQTSLGWVVAGKVEQTQSTKVYGHVTTVDLDVILQKFWEIESVPTSSAPLTTEEEECEENFKTTHSRTPTGRFVVNLPFRKPSVSIGASREIAIRRLKSMERRLSSTPEHKPGYVDFMREYKSLGHMRKLTADELSSNIPSCYIPHHFVLKLSSTTTKLRVVFDASAKTSTGNSLNDALLVGPVVQDNLVDIVMRFRTHPVAFTADITKMYRQVQVNEDDVNMQRIVWREDPSHPIEDYALLTVTYGTATAPYLATRVLQELADNEKRDLPLGSEIMKNDFYVDDCMSGGQNDEDAMQKQQQLRDLASRGGMELRKWCSNSATVMASIPEEEREVKDLHSFHEDEAIKTLGLNWNPSSDTFMFKVDLGESNDDGKFTKRQILSEMSKIFDPLGWVSPVIISGKILMQSLWKLQLGWDEILPDEIQHQWSSFKNDLMEIQNIRIPRCVISQAQSTVELLGFCDASLKAYSGVVFFRVTSPENIITVHLIAAKTRVAPVKTVSLPRLELCGALLLSELVAAVRAAHKNINFHNVTAWTDSTITLAWISSPSSRWKTFVSNRVSKIQESLPAQHWKHIPGTDNPADCASRGITAKELLTHPLWWTGPSFLHELTTSDEPCEIVEPDEVKVEERQVVIATACRIKDPILPIKNYSRISALNRIVAWCRRFINNRITAWKKPALRKSGALSVDEIQRAHYVIIQSVQQQEFNEDYSALLQKKSLPPKSKLLSLTPFLDDNGCMRVGGRLRHANLPRDHKHPLILPRKHHLTSIIIQREHIVTCHAGPQLLLSSLSTRYWIMRGKDAVRYYIKKCVVCTRHTAVTMKQIMGDLPASRLTSIRAFLKTGVDFAGPFYIKPVVRSKVTLKVYLAVFVCFSTRALHLELVTALTTTAFMCALERFVSRRGLPSDIYSDMGTNFVGAARQLKEVADFIRDHGTKIEKTLADFTIQWHFNPPGAPHFGGLWEAGVKSVKFHLTRVIGLKKLTYDELSTVVCQIEACLNSRPITPISADPTDLQALTPGHFLIGTALRSPPEQNLLTTNENRLDKWQTLQYIKQSFWKRWSNEFITRLQQRPKWQQQQKNIEQGDMVIVKDERLPPLHWKLARVIAIHPGLDGQVRVVTLRTADGEFKRPIVKLCLLPLESSTTDDAI